MVFVAGVGLEVVAFFHHLHQESAGQLSCSPLMWDDRMSSPLAIRAGRWPRCWMITVEKFEDKYSALGSGSLCYIDMSLCTFLYPAKRFLDSL